MVDMATTVIIPARNEQRTIENIIDAFNSHPETLGRVFVGIDCETTDDTSLHVMHAGGYPVKTSVHGKGQVVYQTMRTLRLMPHALTDRIILCDGDYTGLTTDHISLLIDSPNGMSIGVPEFPTVKCPDRVVLSWAHVSGFRYLPANLVPAEAHGYLLETQLNLAAIKLKMPVRRRFMAGLVSPFQWPLTERRQRALENDLRWAKDHAIL